MSPAAAVPSLQLRVAAVVIAWAISEPLLLDGDASPGIALAFGLLVTVPLLLSRRAPMAVGAAIAAAYLTQYALGERMDDAMSPELALAFGLFGVAAYSTAAWPRPVVALALAAAMPGAVWAISRLDLGEVEAVAPTQYLYLTAVAFAGVLPGIALRGRRHEVQRLSDEVQVLYLQAANEVGAAVDDERRTLSRDLVRVVEGLIGEIRPLVERARSASRADDAVAALGRQMAGAASRAGEELRSLLTTLTGDPPAAWIGERRRLDLRDLAGLVFPVMGLAALCVADRIELPELPLTAMTATGQRLTIPASAVSAPIGYALAVLTPCGLLLRRRAPVLAIALVATVLVLRVALDELSSLTISQVFVCGALAYAAGAWPRTLVASVTALAIALATTAFCWHSEQYRFDALVYAYMIAVLLGTWLVARAIRDDLRAALALRGRAATLRGQRDRLCRAAVNGQRRDVARELHDIVGHGLSLIVIQAGVVSALAARDPSRARAALDLVDEATGTTQAELTALRSALQDGPEAPGPARSCSRALARIVEDAQAAGQPVLAYVDPRVDELEPDLRAAIVRIAQEALTNARKHAYGAATELEVEVRAERVLLAVRNEPGTTLRRGLRGSQLGLGGMAERARSRGGALEAGPDGPGWAVRAELPRDAAASLMP